MTQEEIKARIDKINNAEFMIQMADHLSRADYDRLRDLNEERRRLEEMLEDE